MKGRVHFNFLLIAMLIFSSSCRKQEPVHQVFRLGYKTDNGSTGPLDNTGFIFRVNDSLAPVFLTAHHVVAGYAPDKYYKWSELKENVSNVWIWSVHDSDYQIKLGENIPIRGAKTAAMDVAAFRIEKNATLGSLVPSQAPARVGDTVRLFSKLLYYDTSVLIIPSKVIYVTDSILVHELLLPKVIRLGGTSGAPILDKNNKLVGCTWGSLAIPDQSVKDKLAEEFPLIHKLDIQIGRTYGIGVPAALVTDAVLQAVVSDE